MSKDSYYFAQFASGFDDPAGDELTALGAHSLRPAYRGLHFSADLSALYRINYQSRLLTRVLAPLITFDCHSAKYLYITARKIEWCRYMSPRDTFAVSAVTANTPGLKHSQYAALKVKDAVCDYFRDKNGQRPDVNTKKPDLGLHLFVNNNRATISIDVSGGSLHKRGYRTAPSEAPLQETLAAAIIRLTGWNGEQPLVDPMCGAGTLLCEAMMHYCRIPAGFMREKWGFQRLPEYSSQSWEKVKNAADAALRPLPNGLLYGSDINPRALDATSKNLSTILKSAGLKKNILSGIDLQCRDFSRIEGLQNSVIVANPPYGIRLGERGEAELLLKNFGDFLKQRCTGCTAFIYVGDRQLLKKVGLRPAWKKDLSNGALAGVLGMYELY